MIWAEELVPRCMNKELEKYGGLLIPNKGGYSMKHIYLHKERAQSKGGALRVVPRHYTNPRQYRMIDSSTVIAMITESKASQEVNLARAKAALEMALIAEHAQIPALSRLNSFLKCLTRVIASQDPFEALVEGMLNRALLMWFTLDSTDSDRQVAQVVAEDGVCGHFDKQHRAELLIPQIVYDHKSDARHSRAHVLTRTFIPRRKVAYELAANKDMMVTWFQSAHMSDNQRGLKVNMVIISV